MAVTFRTEAPTAEEYFELFATTGWNDEYGATVEELERVLRMSWHLVAAYDEGRLVAFGRVMSDTVLHAMIYDLIVRPDHQGQGLGSQILSMLLAHCRSSGIRDIQLFCAKGKEGFYKHHGFVTRPADAPGMQLRSGS